MRCVGAIRRCLMVQSVFSSGGATGPFPGPQHAGEEVPSQGTAGVSAGQMAFLQQIGTVVQSTMQPFAHLTVEMAVDMMQTCKSMLRLLGARLCSNNISRHLRKGSRTSQ